MDIPINDQNQGLENIYLGGDPGGMSSHEFASYMISLGKGALASSGLRDYTATGWDSNNTESIAIGFESQNLFGSVVDTLPGGVPPEPTQSGQNVSMGHRSLANNTGNTGASTGANTLGAFNVAIGSRSLELADGATGNIAVGHRSLRSITEPSFNIGIGHESGLGHNDTGTGYPTTIDLTTGVGNVMVGKYTNTENADNNIIIGDNASTGETFSGDAPDNSINIVQILFFQQSYQ